MGIFYHLIDEITGMFAQVVFCRSQDTLIVILGMGRDDQACAGSSDDTDGACTTMEGIGGTALGEVTHD